AGTAWAAQRWSIAATGAVRDSTLAACYRPLHAPRTGGAYDGHHRTAGIAGRTRRRGSRVADCGAGAAARKAADHWLSGLDHGFDREPMGRRLRAAATRTRLDRGAYCRDRVSLGRG